MKDKTLEQKISLALYGTAIFFAFLFALGLILKTDLFNHWPTANEVYEISRDALTLTAYFLAPATALLLFSDWRMEHVEKTREKQVENIYSSEQKLYSALFDLDSEIEDEESLKEEGQKVIANRQKVLLSDLFKFENLLNEFDYVDEKSLKYKQLAKDILYQYKEMFYYIGLKYSSLLKMNDPKKYNTQYIDETDEQFIDRFQSMYEQDNDNYHEAVEKTWRLREGMNPLKSALMIKNKSS